MAIKSVFTFLEWVQRLTKGYVKHTGKQPDNLAKLKINMEAAQKVKDQGKVVKGDFNPKEEWWKAGKKDRKLTKDELDDLYEEFDEALPYPMETVRDKEKFLKAVKDEEAYMFQQYKMGKLDPKPGEPGRKKFLEKKLEDMELSGDKRLMTRDEIEELSSFDLGTEMDEAIKKSKTLTPEEELRREFPGIDDRLIKNILADKNPQRIAEVKQTMREALKMQEKGMSPDEIIKLFKDTTRTKQASGGIAGQLHLNRPGYKSGLLVKLKNLLKGKPKKVEVGDSGIKKIDVDALKKKYGLDPESAKKDKEAFELRLQQILAKHSTKHAEGGIAGQLHLNEGGRVPMIFGGSPGLKAMWSALLKALNKGRKDKVKTLFPKYSVEEKELLRLGKKYLPKDAATLAAQEAAGKAEGVQILINRLKHDKKILERQAKNKAMKDPNLDFLTKHMEESMPEVYGPHLKKYTDIDKDILQLETIKKNLIMKDRKLNAEGGIAGQLHLNEGGRARYQHGSRQPGLETSTSRAKQEAQQRDIRGLQQTMAERGGGDAQAYVRQHERAQARDIGIKKIIEETITKNPIIQDKRRRDMFRQKETWKRRDHVAWQRYKKTYDQLTSEEEDAIDAQIRNQDFERFESGLSGSIFKKEPPVEMPTREGEPTKNIALEKNILGMKSTLDVMFPDRKTATWGDVKNLLNDAVATHTIGAGDAFKFKNVINNAENSMMLTSNTKIADIAHLVDENLTSVQAERNIGPVQLGADLVFEDGDLLKDYSETTAFLPFENKKVSPLTYRGGVGVTNFEDVFAGGDINYNLGDIDLGLTGYTSEDEKNLIANLGYNTEFDDKPFNMTSNLTYDILNQKPSLDLGVQYNFADDGTLKAGGVFDQSGQNLGITYRRPLKKEPKILGKFAKGGLAKILGV